jgi:hypothetical protein
MFDNLLVKGFSIFAEVMVKIQPVWNKYKVLIGLVVGLILGWFVLGWMLFPVRWTDASPGHLHARYRSAYLAYASEEFYRTGDLTLLQRRLGLDLGQTRGVNVRQIPWLANENRLAEDLQIAARNASQFDLQAYVSSLTGAAQIAEQNPVALFPDAASATDGTAATTPLARGLRIVGVFAVILLVVGAGGVGWYLFAGRGGAATVKEERILSTRGRPVTPSVGDDIVTGDKPLKSFNTPYVLGDDYFDPSFSIEIGQDFLGECGIGISETLGAGDPKKVTAFEAWLFDKSDIRTVTMVMASEYAYDDPDLKTKLEPKGDVVMMQPGQEIVLETTALRVKARIRDLEYAQGASLPSNSFVQRVNFELQAWVKQGDELEGVVGEDAADFI